MSATVNLAGLALHGHMKSVSMLQFNRDGDLLFSSSRDTNCNACCWYAKTGRMLGSYSSVGGDSKRTYDFAMVALDVNRCSTLLATASAGEETLLWSVETGALLGTIHRSLSSGASVGFSHDDRLLMLATKGRGGTKSAVQLYNLPFAVPPLGEDIAPVKTTFNATLTHEMQNAEMITWAAWGPTNDTIYYAEGGYMHILDVETNKVTRSREVHGEEALINRFRFADDYLTLATASNDCTSCLLDYRDLATMQVYKSDVPVNDVSISPRSDHVILGGGIEAAAVTTQGGQSIFEVKFYHKVHGTQLGQLRCHFGTITALTFHPDGHGFASASHDGIIKLYRFDENYESAPGTVPVWSLRESVAETDRVQA